MATSFLAPYIALMQVAAATKPTLNVVFILITFSLQVNSKTLYFVDLSEREYDSISISS
jgi:hypothetical protein